MEDAGSRQQDAAIYHLHVYFTDDTEALALKLHRSAHAHPGVDSVGRFHTEPIGPHPVRQFQLLVQAQHLRSVETWLTEARRDLDVLIHPEIEDDLLAHTQLARWLGTPHPLRLDRFRNDKELA